MNYRRFASLGMALALGAAVGIVPAQSVLAKDKASEKPAAKYAPKLSPAFQKAVVALQTAIAAKNIEDSKTKLAIAEPLATTPDDKFYVGAMRQNLALLMNSDKPMLKQAFAEKLASGSPLVENRAGLIRQLGMWLYDDKDYAGTVAKLNEAEAAGAKDGDLYIRLSDANFKLKQYPASFAAAEKAIGSSGAGEKAPDNWYIVVRQHAYQAGLVPETAEWSRKLARAYTNSDNLHDMVGFYINIAKPGDRERLDLFRLMREMKVMKVGSEYNELADLGLRLRLPGEAKAVLDEGYAAGIVSQGSQQAKDLMTTASGQVAADRSSLAGSEKTAQAKPTGGVAQNVGDAYLGYGDNAKAISLYQLAKAKGGIDKDELNLHWGIALLRSGQKAEAISMFSSVGGTRTELGRFWKTWAEMRP
jgi:tetratricopeptide (TPR) repeat protein